LIEARAEQCGEVLKGGGLELREPIFEIAPQAFDGIEFWRIRRKEEQANIAGQAERLGFMKGAVVEQQQMKLGGMGRREVIEEELKAVSIEGGQFQKKAPSRQRFNSSVQIETLKAIG
jgi:hypothetical protein